MKTLSSTSKRHSALLAFVFTVTLLSSGHAISLQIAQQANSTTEMANASPFLEITPSLEDTACHPGSGWTWTSGPSKPEIATQVQRTLSQIGVETLVEARSYGETDSCGEFSLFAIDFAITVKGNNQISEPDQQKLAEKIYPILAKFGSPNLGNVRITFPRGHTVVLNHTVVANPSPVATHHASQQSITTTEVMNKKVYVLVYDPILSGGQKLSVYKGWNSYTNLTNDLITYFTSTTNNRLNYSVVFTTEVSNVWPVKIDGFSYTEQTYLDVIDGGVPHHEPDTADYGQFMNNVTYDICGKLNRGEIDELWLFGGPWFGFYESRLAGPNGFWYNSPPFDGTACNKLLPIMGFSYERSLAEMVHDFGHRTEATMTKLYGDWQQNRTAHNWDKFGLVKSLSPNYAYSGCGSIHYPPNAIQAYQYSRQSFTDAICDDFFNYPNLGTPSTVKQPVNCMAWSCTDLGFYGYWFTHLPTFAGVAPDGYSNDWWQYLVDSNLVQIPYSTLSATMPISGAAIFSFTYAGISSGFYVDVSTVADMSTDVYLHFTQGTSSPLIEPDPTKWDKYSCGRTLYWRVISNSGIQSPIQSTTITCGTPTCSETVIAPFSGGIYAAQTSNSYQGSITITVAGIGQASGTQYSDAFYIFTDDNGNPITPWYPGGWVLRINGQLARELIPGQQVPLYRSDHVYTFQIGAPGGILTFGVSDTLTNDNTGNYTVTLPRTCTTRVYLPLLGKAVSQGLSAKP